MRQVPLFADFFMLVVHGTICGFISCSLSMVLFAAFFHGRCLRA